MKNITDGKYNYDIELDIQSVEQENDSHIRLLKIVKPGSAVLECGPADGIMTRFLKQKLGCHVTILELDPVCYEHAMQYADAGACADLEQDEWMDTLSDASFDYILYADVLEHLRDPLAVLRKMKRFLKPDGAVLLSVPNVANGDILMNLLCDQFYYTPLGLLDSTHIHLFSRWSLRDMVRKAGYYLAYEGCIRIPIFCTEQAAFLPDDKHACLESALLEHPTRDIYQFICKLTLQEVPLVSDIDAMTEIPAEVVSRFYLDMGEGFSERRRIDVKATPCAQGRCRYRVPLPEGCRAVRYDPIENRACLLRDTAATADGQPAELRLLNGTRLGALDLFASQDPQMLILPPPDARELCIETGFTPLGAGSWLEVSAVLEQLLNEARGLLDSKEEQLRAVDAAKAHTEELLHQLEGALQSKEEQLQASVATIRSMENSLSWRLTKPLRALCKEKT